MKIKIKLSLLFLMMFLIFMTLIGVYLKIIFAAYTSTQSSLQIPQYIVLLLPICFIACIIFTILIIYIRSSIEKPIQLLNARLEEVNIEHPLPPLTRSSNDEIGALYKHFNNMEERLQLANKEQIDMITAIAHDLKTPLTSINGFAELLRVHRDLPETERQEYYELIQKKSKYMAELINEFSRFTKEKLELESMKTKPVNVSNLFEDIAQEYEYELEGLGYKFIYQHSFPENMLLMTNEMMLRRVFGNLISNAVRYGDKYELKVYMAGYVKGGYAFFLIEDNGIGVPDEDLKSLFHKFFTVDRSRQVKSQGMGLGLASCKSIIEYHGGNIFVYHSQYGGLGIKFSLPLMA